jgi:hypothetical protein
MVNVKEGFFSIMINETTTVSKSKEIASKQQVSELILSRQTSEVFLNLFYDSDILNIFLNNKVKYQNYNRLQIIFDDTSKILLIKERTIKDLNVKNIELESKIKK